MRRLLVTVLGLSVTLCWAASTAAGTVRVATLPAIAGISYGPLEEEQMTVFPSRVPGSTSVLLVHGGGWHRQIRETEIPWVAEDLQSAGFSVFDANYPQDSSSQAAFPLEPNAIGLAAEWVRANASAYRGSTSNIVFVGGSAGGQLVEMTAARLAVRGVVSLSGPTNLVSLAELAQSKELRDGLGEAVRLALGCGLSWSRCSQSFEREWSPIDNIPTSCPPYLLFSSVEDEVPEIQQSEFQAALEGAKCPVTLEVLAGNLHSFEYWPKVRAAVDAFIAAH